MTPFICRARPPYVCLAGCQYSPEYQRKLQKKCLHTMGSNADNNSSLT